VNGAAAAADRAVRLRWIQQIAAAGLLGAACCAWAAFPLSGGGGQAIVLVLAAVCVAADLLRVSAAETVLDTGSVMTSLPERTWLWLYRLIRQLPWAEGATVGALVLEVMHRSRPWHTGLLGAALLCYLLATHLAESRAALAVLRPQRSVLAAGAGLLVLGTLAALLPAVNPGLGSGLLRVLAAVAAIAVAALLLPV
jgi:hypothetical protein